MASFLGYLYGEAAGRRPEYGRILQPVARFDTISGILPIATPSAAFKDMQTYSQMTYTKAAMVFHMLRDVIGEQGFRAGMKRYYEKNKLQHVDEEDFKVAMEEASKQDLDWFFQQWLHTNHTLDYAIAGATTAQQPNGTWRTRVDVTRQGQAWMPVSLKVGDVVVRLDSRDPRFSVNVDTPTKPTEAVLDPDAFLLDLDRQNNLKVITN
jgi:aminopeptidase N